MKRILVRKREVKTIFDFIKFVENFVEKSGAIAGVKNVFFNFSEVPKLGINPKSDIIDTPIGIYAYPARYILEKIKKVEKNLKAGYFGLESIQLYHFVPFAGERKYVNVFNVSGNIENFDDEKLLKKYEKSIKNFIYNHKEILKKANIKDLEKFYKKLKKETVEEFGILYEPTILWRMPLLLSDYANKEGLSMLYFCNYFFRKIGIDGFVDLGNGIIHRNRPYQAVFFTIKQIKNNFIFENNFSLFDTDIKGLLYKLDKKGIDKTFEIINEYSKNKSFSVYDLLEEIYLFILKYFYEIDFFYLSEVREKLNINDLIKFIVNIKNPNKNQSNISYNFFLKLGKDRYFSTEEYKRILNMYINSDLFKNLHNDKKEIILNLL